MMSTQSAPIKRATMTGAAPDHERIACISSSSFLSFFSFADSYDYVLMFMGTLGSIGHGLALPVFLYFFAKVIHSLGGSRQQLGAEVAQYALDLVYLGVIVGVSSWTEVMCWMQSGQRQVGKMRLKYLQAILSQDISYFDVDGQTGILIESISRDLILVQEAISEKMGNFIELMATFASGFGVGFSFSWQLCLVTLAVVPAIAFAGAAHTYTTVVMESKSQKAYGEAGTIAGENFSQIRTVVAFGGENRAEKSFTQSLAKTLKLGYKGGLAKGLGFGATYSILFLAWALIVWYGGVLIRRGDADGGKAIGAVCAAVVGGIGLGQGMSYVAAFSKGKASLQAIRGTINRPPSVYRLSDHNGVELAGVKGDIELCNVVFSYPSRPAVRIFDNFSLKISSGHSIALAGESGSGKSTVISLIERFYDPISGQVLLDGVDIQSLRLSWVRDQIGLVNQEPALFAVSILENILYGKEGATKEEVEAAAKAANAHGFISELPLGYQTQVGERGVQLSGGQKQRVAIARAMLKNPKVVLLDEATSALDAGSEKVVQASLDQLSMGRSTVIVAHRLSTIQNADQIAVLQSGKIVEMGTHEELITSKRGLGVYATLVKLQQIALSSDGMILSGTTAKATDSGRKSCALGAQISNSSRTSSGGISSFRKFSLSDIAAQLSLSKRVMSSERRGSFRKTVISDDIEMKAMINVDSEEEMTKSKGTFRFLLETGVSEWPYAVLGSVGAMLAGIANPYFAFVVGDILGAYYEPNAEKMKKDVQKYTLEFMAIGLITMIVRVVQHYYFGIAGENVTASVRIMMFKAIMRNEVGWFDLDENNSKHLVARLSTDATCVRAALCDSLSLIVQNASVVMTACVLAFFVQWRLALLLIATLPFVVASFAAIQVGRKGFSGDREKAYAMSTVIAGDAIENIRTVAAFNAQGKVLALFSNALDETATRGFQRGMTMGLMYGLSQLCNYCAYALVLWYGSKLATKGITEPISVIKVFMVLMVSAAAVGEALTLAPDFANSSKALVWAVELLNRKSKINVDESGKAAVVAHVRGEIELQEVDFAYPTRPEVSIFKGLNLKVDGGGSLALVGPSGSGKSSVISLLERFYDPQSGSVMVDGKDIREFNLKSLRRQMGLVQQEAPLFATSIYDNIAYGSPEGAGEAEVEAAAQAADAHKFIAELPEGYKTQVGERGVQLSGGQKQRVAIARAVLRDPRILLLDEATSALDAQTEKSVQAAVDRLMDGRTTIIVAHRLSSISNAQNIAVVREGRILEYGTYEQLLRDMPRGFFAHLVETQRARQP